MTEELHNLTTKETAARLRVSVPTLVRWRINGTGPAFLKTGGRVLYRVADVETFERESERTSTRSQS